MTLPEFNNLSVSQQFTQAAARGTFLAQRGEFAGHLDLYHLPGNYFVELYRNRAVGPVLWARAFRGPARLAGYAAQVQLPTDWA